ncbi:hypothetical protein J4422_02400 [Candidatus Pacearchaeota archaeon]|nr:hypothetical protein [Candidatus Pacearchaeota archaeon]
MAPIRQYRFYVNNGKVKYFPGLEKLSLVEWHPDDSVQGRILKENLNLGIVPTAIITGLMTNFEKNRIKRALYQRNHDFEVHRV